MELTRGKTAILIILLVGSGYYGYSKYATLQPGKAINNGHSDEFGGPRRERRAEASPEDNKRREEFAKQLNLTPQQQDAMKKLHEQARADGNGREGFRDRMTSMSQILTPQQRMQMAAMRDARRDKGAKAALSGSDFARYQQKRNERRAAGGFGGPGGMR